MQTTKEWMEIPAATALIPHTERIRDIETQVFVSPHDVPKMLRVIAVPPQKMAFEFRYLDEDQGDIVPAMYSGGDVSLFVSVMSGRIRRIEVNTSLFSVPVLPMAAMQPAQLAVGFLHKLLMGWPIVPSKMNALAVADVLRTAFPAPIYVQGCWGL